MNGYIIKIIRRARTHHTHNTLMVRQDYEVMGAQGLCTPGLNTPDDGRACLDHLVPASRCIQLTIEINEDYGGLRSLHHRPLLTDLYEGTAA